MSDASTTTEVGNWDRFWFTPEPVQRMAFTRGLLCAITALFFLSGWSDAEFWYSDGGPLSAERVGAFLQTSGLGGAARWIVSPLFLTDSLWAYRIYLVLGLVTCGAVAAGKGGRANAWVLWLLLIGWANRTMILSSLTESLLSLGLFAAAIAPAGPMLERADEKRQHWSAGFANRLMSVQVSLLAVATFVTMVAGRVWLNGMGAYALAAPIEDRTIDWTQMTMFRSPMVYESLTHLMTLMLPLGLVLAWRPQTNRIGKILLIVWCVLIGALGSQWLYAATLATMFWTIQDRR